MLNLAGGVSIALALRLSLLDIAVRTSFALVLNALVYLNNDYIDVDIDLQSADKDNEKTRYLAAHKRAAFWAQWSLVGLLSLVALFYDVGLFAPLILGGGICWWYSAKLKHVPYFDILAMFIWGVTMPLWATPMDDMLGLAMALQLGMFSSVFESIQVMRDADEDIKEGVRTTGVVLGKRRTLILARVLMVATTVYAALYMHPVAAAVSLIALFIPFLETNIERYWTRVKLVYGVAWLVICAVVFMSGEGSGLLASLRSHAAGHTQ
ncbi:MAG TPA: UbiA family prenyltransferase [Polyangiales bacterium]|nr:UbiA family prenyltransferase [Polyangiales bacterium]